MKKLLLVGNPGIHTENFISLVRPVVSEIHLVTTGRCAAEVQQTTLYFGLRNPVRATRTILSIQKIIRSCQPDVIHILQANSFAFYTLIAAKKFKIPKVISLLGSDIRLMPQRHFLLKSMLKFNLRQTNFITADSYTSISRAERIAGKKISSRRIISGYTPFHNSGVKENLMYSNRLHKKLYRIREIIDGFLEFRKKHGDWKLVIAAEGEETENLKSQTEKLDLQHSVLFAGWLAPEENRKYYSRAKLFISIPESDATSISLLEAMAAGCLPVVSDLDANREWISSGKNGICLHSFKPEEVAKAMEQALMMDEGYARAMNEQIISAEASPEINRRRLQECYEKLLNRK